MGVDSEEVSGVSWEWTVSEEVSGVSWEWTVRR